MSAKTDRILQLAGEGLKPGQIAERMCVTLSTVHNALSNARKAGKSVPHFRARGSAGAMLALPPPLPLATNRRRPWRRPTSTA